MTFNQHICNCPFCENERIAIIGIFLQMMDFNSFCPDQIVLIKRVNTEFMYELERKPKVSSNIIRTLLPVLILILYYVGWTKNLQILIIVTVILTTVYLIIVLGSKYQFRDYCRLTNQGIQIRTQGEELTIDYDEISSIQYRASLKKKANTTFEVPTAYKIITEKKTYKVDLDLYQEESIIEMNSKLDRQLANKFDRLVFYQGKQVEMIDDQSDNREFIVLDDDITTN